MLACPLETDPRRKIGSGMRREETISRKRHTSSSIIRKPREAEVDLAERLKSLERENACLKTLLAEQTLDNVILKEAAMGNF